MANGFAPPLVASIPPDGVITNAPVNQVYLYIPLDLKEGYVQSWNVAVQQALPWSFTFEAAYVGNHNVGVLTRRDINASLIPGSGAAGRPLNAPFGRTTATMNGYEQTPTIMRRS